MADDVVTLDTFVEQWRTAQWRTAQGREFAERLVAENATLREENAELYDRMFTLQEEAATLRADLAKAVEGLEMACNALVKSDGRNSKGAKTAQSILKELQP